MEFEAEWPAGGVTFEPEWPLGAFFGLAVFGTDTYGVTVIPALEAPLGTFFGLAVFGVDTYGGWAGG